MAYEPFIDATWNVKRPDGVVEIPVEFRDPQKSSVIRTFFRNSTTTDDMFKKWCKIQVDELNNAAVFSATTGKVDLTGVAANDTSADDTALQVFSQKYRRYEFLKGLVEDGFTLADDELTTLTTAIQTALTKNAPWFKKFIPLR